MKRYLIIFVAALSFMTAYSQRVDSGFNTGISLEFGYSNVFNPVNDEYDEPEHLFNADITAYGCYLGFAAGSKRLYYDRGYYDTYSENLNTYIFRVGPSFRIGNWRTGLNITPYIGIMMNNYTEEIDENGYGYYDYYGYYNYYPGYNYIIYDDTYSYNIIYGARLSFTYNMFIISGNISNRDVGVSIGIYIN